MEIKLDYSLKTPEERTDLVQKIVENASPTQLTQKYLDILSNYILDALDKKEKKERFIVTNNRQVTIDKRETSYEELVSKFENGEDGVYNLINVDKNAYLEPKLEITEADIAATPGLKQLREAILEVEKRAAAATGKKKFLLKKQLIEMRQNQYVIKSEFKAPTYSNNTVKSFIKADLTDHFDFDEEGEPINNGLLSFFNPKHISALLCNYSALKEESWGNFENDAWYMMEDLDRLIERTLAKDYPLYYDILIYKIDGLQNTEIQELLEYKHGMTHSVEYISSLWRNKIPKLIAEQAKKDYLIWYYTTQEYGKWKKCSKCGEIKLAHNKFFSKNKTSKDGYYSICKDCRNKKEAK
jgi:hypothetical protein